VAIRICFINFWPGAFDRPDTANFLTNLLTEAFGEVERTDDVASAAVVITSVFGNQPSLPAKTIQYIGENQRPNFTRCRFSLSFDYDAYFGRNYRLPLWWWRLEWPEFARYSQDSGGGKSQFNHGFEPLIPIDALMRPRRPQDLQSKKFCALIAGNPEPLRINLFMAMQAIGTTSGYGNLFGNPLQRSKFEVLPEYRFCLCPENGIYPGYHTEKPVDAWFGGCVPLYSGDLKLNRDFNSRALVNYQDYLNMSEFAHRVSELAAHKDAYDAVYAEPLLLQRPSLTESIRFLREAIATIQREAPV
jgi:hypothetical protein